MFFCALQLAYMISTYFHCDAIISVVKLFWCVTLEPMTNSKCNLGLSQWSLLKLESCCDVIKRLFSTAMAGQDNVLAQNRRPILGREWWCRRQMFRWRCHNFDSTKPASWRSGERHRYRRGKYWVRFLGQYRSLGQLLSAQAVGAEGLGFDSHAAEIGTVSLTRGGLTVRGALG